MIAAVAGLRIAVGIKRQRALVEVRGEIDLTSEPTLTDVLNGVADRGANRIVLDLSEVAFMGAGGVRILGQLSRRVAQNGGQLTLRGPRGSVRRLLELFDLDRLVEGGLGEERQPDPEDLLALAEEGARRDLLDAALHAILSTIPRSAGFDGGSVTLRRAGRPSTVAASGAIFEQLDIVQYASGDGPCLTALASGEVIRIEDVRTDHRWPAFAEAATAADIDSVVSTPLAGVTQVIGALNLYARRAEAVGAGAQAVATVAADAASFVLRSASQQNTTTQLRERLSEILAARQTIAHAQGVLAEREGLTVDAAYAVLAQLARAEEADLLDYALEVVGGTSSAAGRPPRTSRGDGRADA